MGYITSFVKDKYKDSFCQENSEKDEEMKEPPEDTKKGIGDASSNDTDESDDIHGDDIEWIRSSDPVCIS